MWVRWLILPLVGALIGACTESDGTASTDNPTRIAVDPADFLGEVPCLDGAGAMRRYVATVEDVTGDLGTEEAPIDSFVLPSSPPVSCTLPVAFGHVVAGHRYVADVDGYDRTDLEPLAPGSRIMLDPETGQISEPRWTTSCGRQDEGTNTAVVSLAYSIVTVRGCAPLVDNLPGGSPTGIRVSLDAALGALACGAESGTVGRFQVYLGGSDAPSGEADCGAAVTLDGFDAPTTVSVRVIALDGEGDTPGWSTECQAVTQPGAIVTVACDLLQDLDLL